MSVLGFSCHILNCEWFLTTMAAIASLNLVLLFFKKQRNFFWSITLPEANRKWDAASAIKILSESSFAVKFWTVSILLTANWSFISVFLKAGEVGYTKWESRYTWLGGHQAPKVQASREVWGYLPELFWALEFWKIMQFCAFGNQFLKNCGPKEKYQISLLELWEE